MTGSLVRLHEERGQLLERIAHQRATLARDLMPVHSALSKADRAVAVARSGLQYVKAHPLPVVLAVAAVAIVRPRGVWRLLGRGLVVWRTWRAVQGWMASPLARQMARRYF